VNIPKYEEGSDGVYRIEIESVGEMVRIATAQGEAWDDYNMDYVDRRISKMGRSTAEIKPRWYNYYTREKLIDAISEPPDKLVMQVESMKECIESATMEMVGQRRRLVRNLEMGDELCPDAWLRRDPNGWSETRRVKDPRQVVRIGVNVSCHAGRKAEDLLYRGAAAAALADALADRGYSVEVSAFRVVRGMWCRLENRRSLAKVIVKESGAPMDLASLAFALSEIGFYRGVIQNACARMAPKKCTSGWGSPCDIPEKDKAGFDIVIEQNVLNKEVAIEVVNKYADGVKTQGAE